MSSRATKEKVQNPILDVLMFLPTQTKIEEDAVHDGQTRRWISTKQNPSMPPSFCQTKGKQTEVKVAVWGEIFCHHEQS